MLVKVSQPLFLFAQASLAPSAHREQQQIVSSWSRGSEGFVGQLARAKAWK